MNLRGADMKQSRTGSVTAMMYLAVLAFVAAVTLPTPSRAETGIIHAVVTKGGFIVGVGGGRGTLTFQGHRYPLRIGGMSFGATIGASTTELRGTARHLNTATDIVGTYSAIGAGAAVAGGLGGVVLQNAKGVILELHGVKVGLELSVAVSGMTVNISH